MGDLGCTICVEEPADYTFFFQSDAADHLHWGYLSLAPQLAAAARKHTNLLHDQMMAIRSLSMMIYYNVYIYRSHNIQVDAINLHLSSITYHVSSITYHVSSIMYMQHVHACD